MLLRSAKVENFFRLLETFPLFQLAHKKIEIKNYLLFHIHSFDINQIFIRKNPNDNKIFKNAKLIFNVLFYKSSKSEKNSEIYKFSPFFLRAFS